jgi:UDP-N-acetyl-D-glucosamine dehydrogenase
MDLVVIGQGYVGLPLSVIAAKSGYRVYGFDIDENKVRKLKQGITDSPEVKSTDLLSLQAEGLIEFVDAIPKLDKAAIFVIAVPTPLDRERNPDTTMLKHACELISKVVLDNSLIINESTSFIGTLTQLIKPIIDKNSNCENLDYAVAPERIDPGNPTWDMKSTPRILVGINQRSTRRAFDFYSKFCSNVQIVSRPEVAEVAKLFENTFRQVNIALVNQLSEIASKLNFSAHEVVNAASTKPYGFMKFYPSIGVGGHCIPVDPTYLAYSAEKVGINPTIINLANDINIDISKKISNRIKQLLGGSIEGKKIQLAGIAYKPNVNDVRESPALLLIKHLKAGGAVVTWYDPIVKKLNGELSTPLSLDIDLGLIVTPHSNIDFTIWKNSKIEVLDLSPTSNQFGWAKFL